ncbi:MAG: tetratricopeptide repeat protein [Candidatus Heimdallarchaeota archaeon]|nr:tetratricopeptide repeat protein [Candidatus Heimdallarchaeota archaeon]
MSNEKEQKKKKNNNQAINFPAELDNLLRKSKELADQFQSHKRNLSKIKQLKERMIELSSKLITAAETYYYKGKQQESEIIYSEILDSVREMNLSEKEYIILNNLGLIYRIRGDYQKALDLFMQALDILQEEGNQTEKGSIFNNIGGLYYFWGDYQKALDYYKEALTIFQNLGLQVNESTALNNIGLIYNLTGNYEEALDFFKEALETQGGASGTESEAAILNNMGSIYRHLKRYTEAINCYKQVLDIIQELGYKMNEGTILNNIGQVYKDWKRYQEALNYFEQALESRKDVGDKAGEGITLSSLGSVSELLVRYDKALGYYQQALMIIQEVGDKGKEGTILNNLGRIHLFLENFYEAYITFKQAVNITEKIVGGMQSSTIRQSFRETNLGIYYGLVHTLLLWHLKNKQEDKKPPNILKQAFRFLELVKAREITDKLKTSREDISPVIRSKGFQHLINEEHQLTREISQLQLSYSKMSLANADNLSFNQQEQTTREEAIIPPTIINELHQKIVKLNSLRTKIYENCHDPGLVKQTADYNPLPSFQKLFEQEPETIVWEFFYDESVSSDTFLILVWTRTDSDVFMSNEISSSIISYYYESFHDALSRASEEKNEREQSIAIEEANTYFQILSLWLGFWLPEKLWDTLSGKELLVLIPHGKLHFFPWSIAKKANYDDPLDHSSNEDDIYLGLTIPIVRNYSLELTVSCLQREKEMSTNFLLVSNPNFNIDGKALPGAKTEVRSIKDFLQWDGVSNEFITLLEQQEATKKAFVEKLTTAPSIIHFAGHAKFNPSNKDPWMSYLAFHSKEGIDPYTVTEMVQNQFIDSPLFILSACETALAEISKGDEPVGIIRGLTLAGATSIIATNWSLFDKLAPHFMRFFYENFFQGETIARALFLARIEIGGINPLDWGVYELYGNPFKVIAKD